MLGDHLKDFVKTIATHVEIGDVGVEEGLKDIYMLGYLTGWYGPIGGCVESVNHDRIDALLIWAQIALGGDPGDYNNQLLIMYDKGLVDGRKACLAVLDPKAKAKASEGDAEEQEQDQKVKSATVPTDKEIAAAAKKAERDTQINAVTDGLAAIAASVADHIEDGVKTPETDNGVEDDEWMSTEANEDYKLRPVVNALLDMGEKIVLEKVDGNIFVSNLDEYTGVNSPSDAPEHIKEWLRESPAAWMKGMAGDPWAGRNQGMRCRTCMFFAEKAVPEGSKRLGRCRRHAPTMNGYPVVFIDDWCGDHKLDESKT